MSVGRSIRVYLVDGTPGWRLTAEIMNRIGHIVAALRPEPASPAAISTPPDLSWAPSQVCYLRELSTDIR